MDKKLIKEFVSFHLDLNNIVNPDFGMCKSFANTFTCKFWNARTRRVKFNTYKTLSVQNESGWGKITSQMNNLMNKIID